MVVAGEVEVRAREGIRAAVLKLAVPHATEPRVPLERRHATVVRVRRRASSTVAHLGQTVVIARIRRRREIEDAVAAPAQFAICPAEQRSKGVGGRAVAVGIGVQMSVVAFFAQR